MARQVERAVVVDDEGRVVVMEKETTRVMVHNEHGDAVTAVVQTAVRGLVLASVQHQQPTTSSADDDEDAEISCCGRILLCLLGLVCLPCLLIFVCCRCCCSQDDD